jgi:hypothetical protein
MPDNVAITAGSGTVIATDDIGGVNYQRVKPAWGADGTAVDVSTAAPLPVAPLGEMLETLTQIGMLLTSLTRSIGAAYPDSSNRLRVVVDAITANLVLSTITTVTTVTTLSTLTNQTQVGGINASPQIPALMQIAAGQLRSGITVT